MIAGPSMESAFYSDIWIHYLWIPDKPIKTMMKSALTVFTLITMIACTQDPASKDDRAGNPFFTGLNDPIQYADVSHEHLTGYATITL
jgi:hypothetical protein